MCDYYLLLFRVREAAVRQRTRGLTGWLFSVSDFRAIHRSACSHLWWSGVFLNGVGASTSSEFHYDVSHKWEDFEDVNFKRKFKLKNTEIQVLDISDHLGWRHWEVGSTDLLIAFGIIFQQGGLWGPREKLVPLVKVDPLHGHPEMPIWGPVWKGENVITSFISHPPMQF